MNKNSILLFVLLYTLHTTAQIDWIRDYKLATEMAMEQKKWIVVDFWASWCDPCKKMDRQLWQQQKINEVKDNFIFLKLDFDQEKELVQFFSIRSIPNILIIDPYKSVIDQKVGFSITNEYIKWLKNFPVYNLTNLYSHIDPMILNHKSSKAYLNLGVAYQNLAMNPASSSIKKTLLHYSSLQFKEILKKSKSENIIHQANLYVLLNKAIAGKNKRVLKKLHNDPNSYTEETQELKHFIKAYCYMKEGDTDALINEKKQIHNSDWLAILSF
ncbi:hypothetical protein AB832_02640 [Flavobacteriaceae bacterium (ex Bugula neritina AB1)]|nr:hypothetical protein AB832_02640 [Flavobacteriaceae bacterium (ex Bugula neritina AB1)]